MYRLQIAHDTSHGNLGHFDLYRIDDLIIELIALNRLPHP